MRWLYTRARLSAERPSVLFDLATARLVERKVLLPGVTVLARLVARVRDRTAARLWRLLAALPTLAQRVRLDTLVQVPDGAHQNPLDRLRRAPIRVSGPGLVQALRRLETLRALGVSHVPLTSIPPSRLKALARYAAAARAQAIARMPDDHYYPELVERYQSVQRFFPALLRTVTFHGTPAGQPVLEALHFLAPPTRQRPPDMQQAPLEVLPRAWRRVMLDTHTRVDRRAYTLCVVQRLQESLRRRDVFVTPSERWGDPRVKLLQGTQWEAMRPQVCRALGHPETAAPALEALTHQLDAAYRRTVEHLPTNTAVRVERSQGRNTLTLTGLDKLADPRAYRPSATRSRLASHGSICRRSSLKSTPGPALPMSLRTSAKGRRVSPISP